jgi:LssY C-terminus
MGLQAKIEKRLRFRARKLPLQAAAYMMLVACTCLFQPFPVHAQTALLEPARYVLKSGTPIQLQLERTISSARARKGDRLHFAVTTDVKSEGFTIIKAGTTGEGSVVAVKQRRPAGMGGALIIALDSIQLRSGERIDIVGRREFKGNSHTIRMGVAMAVLAAIYLPSTPVFLLLRGRDSVVLRGTEVTAYTRDDFSFRARDLPLAAETGSSELSEMMQILPARSLDRDGREGDMLNLMFAANENDLQNAFSRGGWLKVEKSKPQIIWHLLWQRKHYAKLPMYRLYVFGRAPDFSYALPDPKSIVARRHHLRIWRTDRTLNGTPLWVAAATHDVAIEFVKRTFHFSHRIDPNVDAERDFIAANLSETRQLSHEEYLECREPVFEAETTNGQAYHSDGKMLLLELKGAGPVSAEKTEVAVKQ